MTTITGNATAIILPKGGALPSVVLDGHPSPIPFNVSLGFLGHLSNATLNGESCSIMALGEAWRSDATMSATLGVDDNGVSQQTDFSNS